MTVVGWQWVPEPGSGDWGKSSASPIGSAGGSSRDDGSRVHVVFLETFVGVVEIGRTAATIEKTGVLDLDSGMEEEGSGSG